MQYTLEYINRCGDVICRDYFDDIDEATKFVNELLETYAEDGSGSVRALELHTRDNEHDVIILQKTVKKREQLTMFFEPCYEFFESWYENLTDEEIKKCNGDYIGCEICRNRTRCAKLHLEESKKALDEYHQNIEKAYNEATKKRLKRGK